jgi:hypothetical protein
MLEETDALALLTEMWNTESNPEVKRAVGWAGKQIHAAQQRGYTTIEAMAAAFRVHLGPDEKEVEEQRKLAQIQTSINIEHAKQHGSDAEGRAIGNSLRNAAVAGALGAALGMGATTAIGAMSAAQVMSSSLSDGSTSNRPAIGKEPIVPPRPSDSNISIWLKKLNDADPKVRQTAITQLRDLNNLAALGPLGSCFVKDTDAALRQAAQNTGKQIYFSALYWEQNHEPSKNADKAKEILAKAQASKLKRETQL